jgi:hypothetical protein
MINATHVLAVLLDGPITPNYAVVSASRLSLTQAQLDAAYEYLQRALAAAVSWRGKEATEALSSAYVALGAKNPIPDDVDAFLQGHHPIRRVHAGHAGE